MAAAVYGPTPGDRAQVFVGGGVGPETLLDFAGTLAEESGSVVVTQALPNGENLLLAGPR